SHRRGHRQREDISDCERDLPTTHAEPNRELSVDVHNALASIPILFRQTVVLRGMFGYSISEISAMLDVAPGTVKSRYSRGRRLLQDHLVLADYADHRSEEHTSELQSRFDLVCRLLLEKKNTTI